MYDAVGSLGHSTELHINSFPRETADGVPTKQKIFKCKEYWVKNDICDSVFFDR